LTEEAIHCMKQYAPSDLVLRPFYPQQYFQDDHMEQFERIGQGGSIPRVGSRAFT